MTVLRVPRIGPRLLGLAVALLLAACSSSPARPAPVVKALASGYSALGDSYASGEGTGDYQPASDVPGDRCHRSLLAYAPLVDTARKLGKLTFVACAGAATSDLISPNHHPITTPKSGGIEPAQIDSIPPDAKIVTLTIGGNDAGFASVLGSCVRGRVGQLTVFPHFLQSFNGCHDDATLKRAIATRLQALAGTTQAKAPEGTPIVAVADLLARIHARAQQARIYLVGYPELFGSSTGSCAVGDVSVLHVPLVGNVQVRLTVSAADAGWLNEVAGRLNDVLRDAATRASAKHIPATFVDVSGHFAGHRLCDSAASWIAPVTGHADLRARTSGLDSSSFHPTRDGQREGYGAALIAAGIG